MLPSLRRAALACVTRRHAARDVVVDFNREVRVELARALVVPACAAEKPIEWTLDPVRRAARPPSYAALSGRYSSRSASVGSRRDARSARQVTRHHGNGTEHRRRRQQRQRVAGAQAEQERAGRRARPRWRPPGRPACRPRNRRPASRITIPTTSRRSAPRRHPNADFVAAARHA